MNILAIGNSFSQDATRYLYEIAKADGEEITVVNLCIGGCPLSRHYKNMIADKKDYALEFNGKNTGFFTTIKEAVLSRDWDYISFQQVSNQSVDFDTYQPYLSELSSYIKKLAPKAKQVIHQTWAYEENSERLCNELGYSHHADMLSDIEEAYEKAAAAIDADIIIPSGKLMHKLILSGIEKVHRDTFHAKFGVGRYALGLLWYTLLCKKAVEENSFCNFDEPVSESEIAIVKKVVTDIATEIH